MTDELRFRTAQVAEVSFPKRQVDLVVMPYETDTLIVERGKTFTEIVSRGAFDGIEARNDRVRVNRDHDLKRTVGRAIRFHPSTTEGLLAEIHISQTELGDETLTLADDGVLDASAGFGLLRDKAGRVVPNAEVWETRNRVRLNRLFLGHIALTPDPAYESARVLAVRAGTPVGGMDGEGRKPMPNRAALELREWQEKLAVIDSRYSQIQH
jgi:HK97 family phage prohead protease